MVVDHKRAKTGTIHFQPNVAYKNIQNMAFLLLNQKMVVTKEPKMVAKVHWCSLCQKWVIMHLCLYIETECNLCQTWVIMHLCLYIETECNLCQKWVIMHECLYNIIETECNLCQKWVIMHLCLYIETECNLCQKWVIVHLQGNLCQ